jgi:hypothetical protein
MGVMKCFIPTIATIAVALASLLAPSAARADNLHLIDSRPGGYAIYRSGNPSAADYKYWCKLGIQEVYVLAGNADNYEDKFASMCPSIKVLASENQGLDRLPDDRALALFDSWVQDAMAKNKKILFRCNCGCHRTGRLAAYYQMKYQHLTADDAIALMNSYGSLMMFHPELPKQVRELEAKIKKQQPDTSRP